MASIDYPADLFFDIDALVNEALPENILVISCSKQHLLEEYLNNYAEQRALLQQPCQVVYINNDNISHLTTSTQRYDLAIVVDHIEHIDKKKGQQLVAHLRDVISSQFCLAVASNATNKKLSQWGINDFFSLAMRRVTNYPRSIASGCDFALYKYSITNYKKTPVWLNSDNWANPKIWNKYRW